MRRFLLVVPIAVLAFSPSPAQAGNWRQLFVQTDETSGGRPFLDRFAARGPLPIFAQAVDNSIARAGNPLEVRKHALPSLTQFDQGGYVGGVTPVYRNVFTRGYTSAAVPLTPTGGTFATDFGGFGGYAGRVFLSPSGPGAVGPFVLAPYTNKYRTETIRLTDIGTLRPFRKAVLEAKQDKEERHLGGESYNGH